MKNVNLNIRIPKEFRNKIRELADKEEMSQSDFVIMKCLGLKPVERKEKKEYPHRVKSSTGEIKEYMQESIVKITEYVPV